MDTQQPMRCRRNIRITLPRRTARIVAPLPKVGVDRLGIGHQRFRRLCRGHHVDDHAP
jgi:hypothetical protein